MYKHKSLYYLVFALLMMAGNMEVEAQFLSKKAYKKRYKNKKSLAQKRKSNRKVKDIYNRNKTINLKKLNSALLVYLIEEKINQERRKKKREILKQNTTLQKMAVDQNSYMLQKRKIGHKQRLAKKRTLMDRLKFYKGKMNMVGENVLYKSINIHAAKLPSYDILAQKIVKLWVDSDGHYDNIINRKFRLMGTAVAYDAKTKRIYATQVFGKPF